VDKTKKQRRKRVDLELIARVYDLLYGVLSDMPATMLDFFSEEDWETICRASAMLGGYDYDKDDC